MLQRQETDYHGRVLDERFSVKSAYSLLTCEYIQQPNMEKCWSRVWCVECCGSRTNQNVLVVRQNSSYHVQFRKIPSTSLRVIDLPSVHGWRGNYLTHFKRLPSHGGNMETNCSSKEDATFFCWNRIREVIREFGCENKYDGLMADSIWNDTMVGMEWRCENVFGVNGKCRDRVNFIKELTKEVLAANEAQKVVGKENVRVERLIAWAPPGNGWMEMNTDGALHGNPGIATASAVLRDETEDWRGGFALNIRVCLDPLAELSRVYYGLYLA